DCGERPLGVGTTFSHQPLPRLRVETPGARFDLAPGERVLRRALSEIVRRSLGCSSARARHRSDGDCPRYAYCRKPLSHCTKNTGKLSATNARTAMIPKARGATLSPMVAPMA